MTFRPFILSTLLLALSSAGGAPAQASPRYTFSGFGTLGYAALDDTALTYRSSRGGRGTGESGSFALDSRLGLQLDAEFTPALSATLQGVVREDADGDAGATLEWAFVRWFVNDSVTARAGRMALPAFALSDYRDVGYVHTTVRPPEDVYSLVPFSRYDGVDLSVNGELGETLWGFQIGGGSNEETLPDDVRARNEDAYIVNLTVERGPVRVRLSHSSVRAIIELPALEPLIGALRQAVAFVPTLAPIADDLATESIRATFDGIGLRFDVERFFVDAEYAWRRFDGRYGRGDVDSWSLVLGTRVGTLTPYVIASAHLDKDEAPDVELPPVPELAPLAAAIDAAYQDRSQSTLGLGVRWDFAPNLAFKAQAERVSSESRGFSLVRDDDPTAVTAIDDVTLYAVSLDFVF